MSKVAFYQSAISVLAALVVAFSVQSFSVYKLEKQLDKSIAFAHMVASVFVIFILSLSGFVALRNVYTGVEKSDDLVFVSVSMVLGLISLCMVMIDNLLGKPKVFSRLTYWVYAIVVALFVLFSYLFTSTFK